MIPSNGEFDSPAERGFRSDLEEPLELSVSMRDPRRWRAS